jgi:uncharacterized membrane protein HdeD (DUF308 family)
MNAILLRSWWIPALRGALAILFGVLTLWRPDMTLLALVMLFAAYALLSGIVSIVGAIKNRKTDDDWGFALLLGAVGVGAGVVSIIHPDLTALVLVLVIGATAMATGVLDISAAIRLRRVIKDEWLLLLSGVAGVVFGILVFLFPAGGALAMMWLISLYALATGGLLLGLAYRLRSLAKEPRKIDQRVTPDRRGTLAHG